MRGGGGPQPRRLRIFSSPILPRDSLSDRPRLLSDDELFPPPAGHLGFPLLPSFFCRAQYFYVNERIHSGEFILLLSPNAKQHYRTRYTESGFFH
eukprot:scaffold175585_cov22-Tisochrysis_lutea.AAC.1